MRFPSLLVILMVLPLAAAETVHVYSSRHYGGDSALYEAFTRATGIAVQAVEADSSALIARVTTEGTGCPADLVILTDAGNLGQAASAGLLQPVSDPALTAAVPEQYRDAEGHWYGLGRRYRIVVYHPDRVPAAELPGYAGLADPCWKGRIAVRSSGNIYNQSLLASRIAHDGVAAAEAWAAGVLANLARPPQGNDRAQITAVATGEADLAIVNHYYYLQMLASSDPAEQAAAQAVRVHIPDQAEGQRGAHTNITGAGVLKHAPQAALAVKLLTFLASVEGQALFIAPSREFPISGECSSVPAGLPAIRADLLPVGKLAEHNAEAVKIFDRVGWR